MAEYMMKFGSQPDARKNNLFGAAESHYEHVVGMPIKANCHEAAATFASDLAAAMRSTQTATFPWDLLSVLPVVEPEWVLGQIRMAKETYGRKRHHTVDTAALLEFVGVPVGELGLAISEFLDVHGILGYRVDYNDKGIYITYEPKRTTELDVQEFERQFLLSVGFDMSHGFTQQDVDTYAKEYPDRYKSMVTDRVVHSQLMECEND